MWAAGPLALTPPRCRLVPITLAVAFAMLPPYTGPLTSPHTGSATLPVSAPLTPPGANSNTLPPPPCCRPRDPSRCLAPAVLIVASSVLPEISQKFENLTFFLHFYTFHFHLSAFSAQRHPRAKPPPPMFLSPRIASARAKPMLGPRHLARALMP